MVRIKCRELLNEIRKLIHWIMDENWCMSHCRSVLVETVKFLVEIKISFCLSLRQRWNEKEINRETDKSLYFLSCRENILIFFEEAGKKVKSTEKLLNFFIFRII